MLKNLFRKKKKRVVVFGIDGVPCSLLRKFIDQGIMPNLAGIVRNGTLCEMTASIPEVSSTSWSTFMTGVNPGRHGIYGFMELQGEKYSWKFPGFNDLKSKTIWDIAGENGKKSIVVNIPSTYPAKPLEGSIVSGFVAVDLKKATYPESMYRYLSGMGYRLDVDTSKAAGNMDDFTADIMSTFRKRQEAILHLHESEEWDLFIAVVTETDRLHHYLWAALEDTSHPQHGFFLDFYGELDRFIGVLYEKTGDEIPFVILSDHGFTAVKKEVYLNSFLRERGYLDFTKPVPESFADIESGSRAFVLDPSRVYLHLKDRFPRGSVEAKEYERLRKAVKDEFLSLEVDGEKVVREVLYREEIYSGACFDQAPDMVLLSKEGYDLKGSIAKQELAGTGPFTGCHTRDNATFFINRETACGNPNIVDVGATVLRLLGMETGNLDGTPLV